MWLKFLHKAGGRDLTATAAYPMGLGLKARCVCFSAVWFFLIFDSIPLTEHLTCISLYMFCEIQRHILYSLNAGGKPAF